MTSFSMNRKKTPFQKHREEEEAKKKRAENETARLYEEFVESFRGNTPGEKAFVRGGLINPNERVKGDNEGGNSKDGVSVPKKGTRYVPSFVPVGLTDSLSKGKEPEKKKDEKPREKDRGKMQNIDNFMEELKLEQEMREKRNQEREQWRDGHQSENSAPTSRFDELPDEFDPFGKFPGSFDDGDPQTTNLYVGNLSPKVDENFLLRTFGRFGPIASVKIMWPRTEEEKRRQRNCGFVGFMNRADGQAAKDEMQRVVVYEYELKIGWGKSVSLPAQALPAPPPGQMAIRSKEGCTVILSGPEGAPVASVTNQNSELVLTPNVPDIMVCPPEDDHLRHIIDTMAMYVLDDGCAFEQSVMERGRGNPIFSFLFELGSKEHTYYVWRLYSFAQGDTLQRWRTEPFIMITGSGRWIPPSLPSSRSPVHEKGSMTTYAAGKSRRVEVERALTDPQRDEFEDMLRALTLERNQIKEAMGFALDNADAAGEVVEVLTESLTLKETSIPTKVARLMLVSDVLHNSSAPVRNASAYRTKFEGTLPDIMESFNDLYRSITGRITAEALKERVLKVLQVWSDWFLFSDSYINGLRATFLRPGNSGVVPFHSICGDAPELEQGNSVTEDSSERTKPNQDTALAMGKGAAMQELLNLAFAELERRCRHNGLSLCGGREMMVLRLLSLEEAEKLRGSESFTISGRHLRDDETGGTHRESKPKVGAFEPASGWSDYGDELRSGGVTSNVSLGSIAIPEPEVKAFARKKSRSEPLLPDSKWAREDIGSDDEDKKGAEGLGLSYSSSGSEDVNDIPGELDDKGTTAEISRPTYSESGISEEHRQKLRRLEVAVLEYRESLEERGSRNADEIEKKVADYRRRMQCELEVVDPNEDIGGSNRHTYRSERTSLERKDKHDARDSSRKRHRSRSRSTHRQLSMRDREKSHDNGTDRERDRRRDKERSHHDQDKSGYRERDGQDSGDKSRERSRRSR